MIFRQITHDDLGCASYLIGDEDAGVAAVEHILETHNHACLLYTSPSPRDRS